MKSADSSVRANLPTSGKKAWGNLLGYLFAIACLVWVLHSVDFSAFAQQISGINWMLMGVGIFLDVASFVVQGWRWALLLRPLGRLSVFEATRAVYTGLFVNEVVPLKIGEAVRGLLVARQLKTGFTKVIPTILVERFFDGVWLAAGFAATAYLIGLPASILKPGEFFIAALLLAFAVFVLLIKLSPTRGEASAKAAFGASKTEESTKRHRKWRSSLTTFVAGLRSAGTRPASLVAFLLSMVLILMQAGAFWVEMRAFGITVSFVVGLPIFLIVHLGSAVPGAPSNIGSYQFFTVLALTLFGIEESVAAGFSIFVFLILTAPLWILGFVALVSSGFTLGALREEIAKLSFKTLQASE